MSYAIDGERVSWKGKRLKVAAEDIVILHPHLARAGNHILLGAKRLNVDAASFEVLSPGFARDEGNAYEILETTLKPIKGADPESFQSLSATYARDDHRGYYRSKAITKCDPASLTALHAVFAADEHHLYFTNKKLAKPKGPLDLANASVQAAINEVNRPAAILSDKTHVYVMNWGDNGWSRVEGVEPANFGFLTGGEQADMLDRPYQRDQSRVFFKGRPVEGADPTSTQPFGKGLIRDGGKIWFGTHRLDENADVLRDGEIVKTALGAELTVNGRASTLYRDAKGVWSIQAPPSKAPYDPPKITYLADSALTELSVDEALGTAYRAIFAIVGRVFRQLPFTVDFRNLPEPASEIPPFEFRRDGSHVEVLIADEPVSAGPISMWISHASAFWAKTYGRRERLYIYPDPNWMPPGDELHVAVAKAAARPMLDLAAALYFEGEEDEAQLLAHLVLYRAFEREMPPELLARVPLELVGQGSYLGRKYGFDATTNLAAAREVLRKGLLDEDDFRVRYEMLRLIHGVMNDTNKKAHFYAEIIPEIIDYQTTEPHGLLRETIDAIVEMALVKAFVGAEVSRENHYAAIEPLVRRQIAHGANTDWNRSRLIEALWALDRKDEAEAESKALLADCPDDWPAPPRYSNRHHWRNYRLKLMYGRLVATWCRPMDEVSFESAREVLSAEVDALRVHFGHPADWPEFQTLDQTLDMMQQSAHR